MKENPDRKQQQQQQQQQKTRSLTESCKTLLMQLENIQFRIFFRMYYNYSILFH